MWVLKKLVKKCELVKKELVKKCELVKKEMNQQRAQDRAVNREGIQGKRDPCFIGKYKR